MNRRGGLVVLLLVSGCGSPAADGDQGAPPTTLTETSPAAVSTLPAPDGPLELRADGSWSEGPWEMIVRRDADGLWCIEFDGDGSPGVELCDGPGLWDGEAIVAIDGDRIDPDNLVAARQVFFYGLVPGHATGVEFRDPYGAVVAAAPTFALSGGGGFRAYAVRNLGYALEPSVRKLPDLALVALDDAGREVARRSYEATSFMDPLPGESEWGDAWRWQTDGIEILGVRAVALVSPSMSAEPDFSEGPEFMEAICLRFGDRDLLTADCVRAPNGGRLVDSAVEFSTPSGEVVVVFGVSSDSVPSLTATLDDGSLVEGVRFDLPDARPADPAFMVVRLPDGRWIESLGVAGRTITLTPETNGTL